MSLKPSVIRSLSSNTLGVPYNGKTRNNTSSQKTNTKKSVNEEINNLFSNLQRNLDGIQLKSGEYIVFDLQKYANMSKNMMEGQRGGARLVDFFKDMFGIRSAVVHPIQSPSLLQQVAHAIAQNNEESRARAEAQSRAQARLQVDNIPLPVPTVWHVQVHTPATAPIQLNLTSVNKDFLKTICDKFDDGILNQIFLSFIRQCYDNNKNLIVNNALNLSAVIEKHPTDRFGSTMKPVIQLLKDKYVDAINQAFQLLNPVIKNRLENLNSIPSQPAAGADFTTYMNTNAHFSLSKLLSTKSFQENCMNTIKIMHARLLSVNIQDSDISLSFCMNESSQAGDINAYDDDRFDKVIQELNNFKETLPHIYREFKCMQPQHSSELQPSRYDYLTDIVEEAEEPDIVGSVPYHIMIYLDIINMMIRL